MKATPPHSRKGHSKQPQYDIVSALRQPSEIRLAANEIQEEQRKKEKQNSRKYYPRKRW